jgi:hypothetical protein
MRGDRLEWNACGKRNDAGIDSAASRIVLADGSGTVTLLVR